MKRILSEVIIVILFITTAVFASGPNDITYMTEQYPPYNFQKDKEVEGIAADVMLAIMKKLNVDRTIQMLPWVDSYNKLRKTPNTCLFSVAYTKNRAPLFKWVGPVASSNVTLVALKKNKIKINSFDDVNQYKVGVIRSDIAEQLLVKGGVKRESLDQVLQPIQNIKKLAAGGVDLVAYDDIPLKWKIKQNGYNPEDFETVFQLSKGELYFAFHKDTSKTIIDDFQNALDALKADGTYQKILDKYLK